MDLATQQLDGTLVVSFVSELNLEGDGSLRFKDQLKNVIADAAQRVVLDLGNVGFIDSQGLATLISALKSLRESGGSLVLANVSEPVEAVLRITRLVRVFELHPSVQDALGTVEITALQGIDD